MNHSTMSLILKGEKMEGETLTEEGKWRVVWKKRKKEDMNNTKYN